MGITAGRQRGDAIITAGVRRGSDGRGKEGSTRRMFMLACTDRESFGVAAPRLKMKAKPETLGGDKKLSRKNVKRSCGRTAGPGRGRRRADREQLSGRHQHAPGEANIDTEKRFTLTRGHSVSKAVSGRHLTPCGQTEVRCLLLLSACLRFARNACPHGSWPSERSGFATRIWVRQAHHLSSE
jgi:hypothetical protein